MYSELYLLSPDPRTHRKALRSICIWLQTVAIGRETEGGCEEVLAMIVKTYYGPAARMVSALIGAVRVAVVGGWWHRTLRGAYIEFLEWVAAAGRASVRRGTARRLRLGSLQQPKNVLNLQHQWLYMPLHLLLLLCSLGMVPRVVAP